jgi:glycosyltransferase involved in cell wall biosynthesis
MQYNFVNDNTNKSVTVITPTIGSKKLADAVESVSKQTYKNLKHLVVVDGPEFFSKAVENTPISLDSNVILHSLPFNTGCGSQGFYGHRIYAGIPHLVNSDYIFFLDDDNWYEPDHVETLVDVLDKGHDFAFSLRKIFDKNRNYICDDNCESLGKWPIYFTHHDPQYLVDTSSFAFNRQFLNKTSHLWHFGWGGDRRFFSLIKDKSNHDSSRKHTLCYRLDGNEGSVKESFFINGNQNQNVTYNGKLPWKTF